MTNPIDEILNGTPELTDAVKETMLQLEPITEAETQQQNEFVEEEASSTQTSQPTNTSKEVSTELTDKQKELLEKRDRLRSGPLAFTKEVLKGTVDTTVSQARNIAAVGAGVADFGIGLLNKIPKKNIDGIVNPFHYVDENGDAKIKPIPEFENQTAQAIRNISSVVVPSMWLTAKFRGLGIGAHSKVGWSLGNDSAFRWFANTGLAAGAGAIVDEIAPIQEKDHNATGMLKKSFPKTLHWIPDRIATLDSDSSDIKRQKNRDEGIFLSLLSDTMIGVGKLYNARAGILDATKWVPENEKGKIWKNKKIKRVPLSKDPVENEVLNSAKRRTDALDELAEVKIKDADGKFDEPTFSVHDVFDPKESGIRSVDEGGITAAGVDAVRTAKNIDSFDGRLGSVMTDASITKGLQLNEEGDKLIRQLAKELRENQVTYKGTKTITHKDVLAQADKLAADLLETDIKGMKELLDPELMIDPSTKAKVLGDETYAAVFKAIGDYMRLYTDLDISRAKGILATSVSGQVSDMAEGARLVEGTSAVSRAQDQILDRIQYLMVLKGQTSYARGRALNMINLWQRAIGRKADVTQEGLLNTIKSEKSSTLEAIERIKQEAADTVDTLRAVKAERPQMLGPLMLAYEVTDGKVDSIGRLNTYVRESTGVVRKSLIDARADMPSAWTQGMWANIYNSVLSSVGTPLKAGLSNVVLMIERPLATYAGAIAARDWATVRRANYMYMGMGDTMQKSLSHFTQVFKRASRDPNSVGYIMRDDIVRKNEEQMTFLRSFADAQEELDNFGPSAMVNQIEALNDLAEHPVMRFSANSMTAFDGFTRSWIGNVEARGRAFDQLVATGQKLDTETLDKISAGVYDEMFDGRGFITDQAVEYASREIAMNLDSPAVKALNTFITQYPVLKPFLMFPKTSANLLQWAGSHNPLGFFIDDLNKFGKPFNQMTTQDAQELLSARGILTDETNLEAAYNTVRAELKGRKAIGSLTASAATILFMQDRIRGNGLYDKTRQKTRRELGWTPRTIKGLDGKWYSYDGLGAISDWLALTTDVMDNFDTLDTDEEAAWINRMGFILSANLTNKSYLAGLEPLNDMLTGNPAAINRWLASFGSSFVPMSGMRNELSRLLTPQLKEVEMEFTQLLANRNPIMKDRLPDAYDWIDGTKIREPESFWTRAWNTYSPTMKKSDAITPEKQFLIDIEFDGRPSLQSNGQGIDYTPEERSAITQAMGRGGFFKREIRKIMNSTDAKEWRKAVKAGNYDRELYEKLHYKLNLALSAAQRYAEATIPQAEKIKRKTWLNNELRLQQERGGKMEDIQRILELQRLE